jgi:hypothetical protein
MKITVFLLIQPISMYSLSEQLRTRAKVYFSRKFGREVKDDEAEQYLLSLAHLYDLFITKE